MTPQRSTAPVTYRITFGDEGPGHAPYETTKANFAHNYTAPGFYIMSVLATDADLRTSSSFATVQVSAEEGTTAYAETQPAVGNDPSSFAHTLHIGYDNGKESSR